MHGFYFHPFGLLMFLLLVGLLIAGIVSCKRKRDKYDYRLENALMILDSRLAKGEISIDEYNDILSTLNNDKKGL
ncbi:hypothetical protein [Gracilibacillus sp. JCM 18860]|uniref:hypothetical protein n=1 Tax=Gracilibacillus sp. JCM 18860 TaxID=1306159 RepID=UPI0006D1B1EE